MDMRLAMEVKEIEFVSMKSPSGKEATKGTLETKSREIMKKRRNRVGKRSLPAESRSSNIQVTLKQVHIAGYFTTFGCNLEFTH